MKFISSHYTFLQSVPNPAKVAVTKSPSVRWNSTNSVPPLAISLMQDMEQRFPA